MVHGAFGFGLGIFLLLAVPAVSCFANCSLEDLRQFDDHVKFSSRSEAYIQSAAQIRKTESDAMRSLEMLGPPPEQGSEFNGAEHYMELSAYWSQKATLEEVIERTAQTAECYDKSLQTWVSIRISSIKCSCVFRKINSILWSLFFTGDLI